MNLYRTSESGVAPVRPLDPAETAGLAGALLRGPGGTLGSDDLLFVSTAAGDGNATALALDAEGTAVIVAAADGEVGSDAVTDALQRASAAADRSYDALDGRFEGERSLREAHAAYFDREPLAPAAFNADQRVRLVGTAFDGDALDLAGFLSDRELSVDAVRVEAFGDPASEEFLVRFESVERGETAGEADAADDQWVAGGSAAEGATATVDEDTSANDGEADDGDGDATSEDGTPDDEPLERAELLSAVAEGLQERLVGTFDADVEDVISVERGSELLVRPDHPAYAGGVLRYRLQAERDGTVEFAVNIYGGSEAEKERMRAVVRENQADIEAELGYGVSEGYDGFSADLTFPEFDRTVASEIVDEFDRLVRFFHPRVMRA